ncbi:MAG: superoxide dismutase family protein [bacterium]
MKKLGFSLVMILLVVVTMGCQKQESDTEETAMETASAEMAATQGSEAHGTVTFTKTDEGIRVVANFEGVPEGTHGFHIHQYGDCSSGDGKSAGGHFNPEGVPHAGPDAAERHVGDLGNISADENGVAHADFVDSKLTFEGENSIIGKGVILHADADDLTTQPTGAAGARISCGVITASEK